MTPCREWQGARSSGGYGVRRREGQHEYIHRAVVEMVGEDQFGTPWEPSLRVLHQCDNPPCFRFDHLKLGTQGDNLRDMFAKGRNTVPDRRGEKNHFAMFTNEQADVIRASDLSNTELAKTYGVHRTTIQRLRDGRTYNIDLEGDSGD